MPRATIRTEAQHIELKSLEGGWIELRQLPYYDMLVRRDRGGKLFFDAEQEGRVEIATLQAWARAYEFEHCILDHNLEDENGNKLDFSNELTLKTLDPRVGQEIEDAIDKLHNTEDDVKGFPSPASTSLEDNEDDPSIS